MSIQAKLAAGEGSLAWRFQPPGYTLKRRLYLSAKAQDTLVNPNSATNLLGLRGFIQAAMIHWVTGGRIRADEKGKARFIKRLKPPPTQIWEIRATDPMPQVRLLGRLVEQDTIVLHRIHTRRWLDQDDGWNEAMTDCDAFMAQLFSGEPIFAPTQIQQCVKENYDDYPI